MSGWASPCSRPTFTLGSAFPFSSSEIKGGSRARPVAARPATCDLRPATYDLHFCACTRGAGHIFLHVLSGDPNASFCPRCS